MAGMKDLFGDMPYELPSPSPERAFDGSSYDVERDYVRLNAQQRAVFDFMKDGAWRTLTNISKTTGYPEASVSARLRDFRKKKYGGHEVQRKRVAETGLWAYRLEVIT